MDQSIVLLFPGQGSQYVGMGKNLDKEREGMDEIFKCADRALGYSLSQICWEGPEEKLKLTENTQPAILTHSYQILQKLLSQFKGIDKKITKVLGHSVGEFSALVAAGSIAFEDAVKIVHHRGKFMQEAVPAGQGKMVALLKVPEEIVREACRFASFQNDSTQNNSAESLCNPANFNDPEQIVISGHGPACERAVEWIKNNFSGKFRAVELPVSAPFHSPLMLPAEKRLAQTLTTFQILKNKIPYVANVDAKEYAQGTDPDIIVRNLVHQVSSSVLWTQSMSILPADTLCLEIGPGRVLKNLAKKIRPDLKVMDMDSRESFEELKDILKW